MLEARKLFLLGDTRALEAVAADFLSSAGEPSAKIALLSFGGRWREYLPTYQDILGVEVKVVVPDEHGVLDLPRAVDTFEHSTGIVIGGGPVRAYQRLFVQSPLGQVLRESYARGVPFAGISAEAMLMAEHIAVYGDELEPDLPNTLEGLGLLEGWLVMPHFTKDALEGRLVDALGELRLSTGWGLDETGAVLLENGVFARAYGTKVYRVQLENFETGFYVKEEIRARR